MLNFSIIKLLNDFGHNYGKQIWNLKKLVIEDHTITNLNILTQVKMSTHRRELWTWCYLWTVKRKSTHTIAQIPTISDYIQKFRKGILDVKSHPRRPPKLDIWDKRQLIKIVKKDTEQQFNKLVMNLLRQNPTKFIMLSWY